MEMAELKQKGNIVIPHELLRGIRPGTPFAAARHGKIIILRAISGLSRTEQEEMVELDEIWKEIEQGKCQTYSEEEFFERFAEW